MRRIDAVSVFVIILSGIAAFLSDDTYMTVISLLVIATAILLHVFARPLR